MVRGAVGMSGEERLELGLLAEKRWDRRVSVGRAVPAPSLRRVSSVGGILWVGRGVYTSITRISLCCRINFSCWIAPER